MLNTNMCTADGRIKIADESYIPVVDNEKDGDDARIQSARM